MKKEIKLFCFVYFNDLFNFSEQALSTIKENSTKLESLQNSFLIKKVVNDLKSQLKNKSSLLYVFKMAKDIYKEIDKIKSSKKQLGENIKTLQTENSFLNKEKTDGDELLKKQDQILNEFKKKLKEMNIHLIKFKEKEDEYKKIDFLNKRLIKENEENKSEIKSQKNKIEELTDRLNNETERSNNQEERFSGYIEVKNTELKIIHQKFEAFNSLINFELNAKNNTLEEIRVKLSSHLNKTKTTNVENLINKDKSSNNKKKLQRIKLLELLKNSEKLLQVENKLKVIMQKIDVMKTILKHKDSELESCVVGNREEIMDDSSLIITLKNKGDELSSELATQTSLVEEKNNHIKELNNAIIDLTTNIKNKEEDINNLKTVLEDLNQKFEKETEKTKNLKNKNEALKEKEKDLREEIQKLKNDVEEKLSELALNKDSGKKLKELLLTYEQVKEDKLNLDNKVKELLLQKDIQVKETNDFKEKNNSLSSKLNDLTKNYNKLNKENQKAKEENEDLYLKINSLNEDFKIQNKKIEDQDKKFKDLSAEMEIIKDENKELKSEIIKKEENLKILKDKIAKLKIELTTKQSSPEKMEVPIDEDENCYEELKAHLELLNEQNDLNEKTISGLEALLIEKEDKIDLLYKKIKNQTKQSLTQIKSIKSMISIKRQDKMDVNNSNTVNSLVMDDNYNIIKEKMVELLKKNSSNELNAKLLDYVSLLESIHEETKTEKNGVEEAYIKLNDQISALMNDFDDIENEITNLKIEREELSKKLLGKRGEVKRIRLESEEINVELKDVILQLKSETKMLRSELELQYKINNDLTQNGVDQKSKALWRLKNAVEPKRTTNAFFVFFKIREKFFSKKKDILEVENEFQKKHLMKLTRRLVSAENRKTELENELDRDMMTSNVLTSIQELTPQKTQSFQMVKTSSKPVLKRKHIKDKQVIERLTYLMELIDKFFQIDVKLNLKDDDSFSIYVEILKSKMGKMKDHVDFLKGVKEDYKKLLDDKCKEYYDLQQLYNRHKRKTASFSLSDIREISMEEVIGDFYDKEEVGLNNLIRRKAKNVNNTLPEDRSLTDKELWRLVANLKSEIISLNKKIKKEEQKNNDFEENRKNLLLQKEKLHQEYLAVKRELEDLKHENKVGSVKLIREHISASLFQFLMYFLRGNGKDAAMLMNILGEHLGLDTKGRKILGEYFSMMEPKKKVVYQYFK